MSGADPAAKESLPLVLCDCPFFPEFQALFDAKVRCLFVTELLGNQQGQKGGWKKGEISNE